MAARWDCDQRGQRVLRRSRVNVGVIQVSVSSISGLGTKAEAKVITYVTSFTKDLLKEAGRVEKDRRAPGVKQAEITESDVSDANAVLRRVRRSRSRTTVKVA